MPNNLMVMAPPPDGGEGSVRGAVVDPLIGWIIKLGDGIEYYIDIYGKPVPIPRAFAYSQYASLFDVFGTIFAPPLAFFAGYFLRPPIDPTEIIKEIDRRYQINNIGEYVSRGMDNPGESIGNYNNEDDRSSDDNNEYDRSSDDVSRLNYILKSMEGLYTSLGEIFKVIDYIFKHIVENHDIGYFTYYKNIKDKLGKEKADIIYEDLNKNYSQFKDVIFPLYSGVLIFKESQEYDKICKFLDIFKNYTIEFLWDKLPFGEDITLVTLDKESKNYLNKIENHLDNNNDYKIYHFNEKDEEWYEIRIKGNVDLSDVLQNGNVQKRSYCNSENKELRIYELK